MNFKELKERIQTLTDEGVSDDTKIFVYADHGQSEISAGYVSLEYCEDSNEYYPTMVPEGDIENTEDYDKVIVISD